MYPLMLPLIIVRRLPQHLQKEVMASLLPNVLASSQAQGVLLSAVTLERQARLTARREQEMVTEAIQAAGFETADALASHPALKRAFDNLSPADKIKVFEPSTIPDPEINR